MVLKIYYYIFILAIKITIKILFYLNKLLDNMFPNDFKKTKNKINFLFGISIKNYSKYKLKLKILLKNEKQFLETEKQFLKLRTQKNLRNQDWVVMSNHPDFFYFMLVVTFFFTGILVILQQTTGIPIYYLIIILVLFFLIFKQF